MRGQGYDGASNMRGALNGFQALFIITDVLCQALQRKSQDILTSMRFVHTTKLLLQALRDDGW
ncbi:hypothetical protein OROHE_010350 [Orobanche hederae]